MSTESKIIIGILIASAVIILFSMIKSKRFFRNFFFSAFQGLAALFAVNIISSITGVSLAINYITGGISIIFGCPGVIGLLIAKVIAMR